MFGIGKYALGGVAAIVVAALAIAGVQTWRISGAQQAEAKAEARAETAETALERAQQTRQLIEQFQESFAKQAEASRDRYRTRREETEALRSENAEVESFLGRRVPDDLRRLHNDNDSGPDTGKSDAAVPNPDYGLEDHGRHRS